MAPRPRIKLFNQYSHDSQYTIEISPVLGYIQGVTKKNTAEQHCKLTPERVIFTIQESELPELPEDHETFGVIGQDRAIQAIEMALAIPSKGYNIFATGPAGTGKRTAIQHILGKQDLQKEQLRDIAYVHNFSQEDSPRVLIMPAGEASRFRSAIRKTILDIQALAQEIQHRSSFQHAKEEFLTKTESQENQLLFNFEDRLQQEGFKIVQIEENNEEKADLAAVVNDNLTNIQDLHQMVSAGELEQNQYQDLREKYSQFMEEMKQLFTSIQRNRRRTEQYLLELHRESIAPEVHQRLSSLGKDFPYPSMEEHLEQLGQDIIEQLPIFLDDPSRTNQPGDAPGSDDPSEEPSAGTSAKSPRSTERNKPGRPGQQARDRRDFMARTSPQAQSNPGSGAPGHGESEHTPGSENARASTRKPGTSPSSQGKSHPYRITGLPASLTALPDELLRYDVNILVDHSKTTKPPIIFETYPDFTKLFGSIDTPSETSQTPGTTQTERPGYLSLRPGSLLRANGGYLILQAEDLLMEEETYISLKRALQNCFLEMRTSPNPYGHGGSNLKPQPIPLNLKVVILGNDMLYDLLYMQDEDFQKLFKVPAEFDYIMDRNNSTTREYIHFIRMIQREESLLPVDSSGVAALLEYGVRLAELRSKLSTQFSQIADILREANYWAGKIPLSTITRQAINKALEARAFLLNLPEEKIDEQIRTGELLMLLEGTAIGRVNGLAVLDRGYYSFGRPTVITAQAAPGTDGIINVEREAGLSGEIHDKGTYIVESYIHATYARSFPFSMTARLCFEQSYVEVDGDSASSTEIYALLSAIGSIPLRQDIAVTGSVNQMGDIQPVGGVIEKIEGFYQVCKQHGLTGSQGVIIPAQNIESLILNAELNQAVQEGRFHIWAISNVNQGIEILTGMPAGNRTQKGVFQQGTVNGIVEKKLRAMSRISKEHDSQ